MTRPLFGTSQSKIASGRDEERELRPPLTARKEAPSLIAPGPAPQAPPVPPRATARHFAGRRGVSTVRDCPPPDSHRRKVVAVAKKVLTPNGGRRVLAQQVAYIRKGVLDAVVQDGVFFNKEENRADPREFVERAVVLDLSDGRLAHFLMRDARSVMCLDQVREGAVVEVIGAPRGRRSADQVIVSVAAARDGVWSAADHAAVRPGDWPKSIAFHEKRAEAMSAAGACVALESGRFAIPADYLVLARQADVAQWGEAEPRLAERDLGDRSPPRPAGEVRKIRIRTVVTPSSGNRR